MRRKSNKTLRGIQMKTKLKSFSLLTGSILLMAVGIYFFKFSNNFTFGGITGLAVLVAKSGFMSAGDFTFIMNMVLLLIGFLILGKDFGIMTAYWQYSSFRSLVGFGKTLPNDKTDDGSAYVRIDFCHCTTRNRIGSAF